MRLILANFIPGRNCGITQEIKIMEDSNFVPGHCMIIKSNVDFWKVFCEVYPADRRCAPVPSYADLIGSLGTLC